MALLVAVFPANIHVALQGHMPGTTLSPVVLWWRLPLQFIFLTAVWWVALAPATQRVDDSGHGKRPDLCK